MGKGDLRTRRGKIYNGSHGKTRPGRAKKKKAETGAARTAPRKAEPAPVDDIETKEPGSRLFPFARYRVADPCPLPGGCRAGRLLAEVRLARGALDG
jgi:30S ribosomal protein S31